MMLPCQCYSFRGLKSLEMSALRCLMLYLQYIETDNNTFGNRPTENVDFFVDSF